MKLKINSLVIVAGLALMMRLQGLWLNSQIAMAGAQRLYVLIVAGIWGIFLYGEGFTRKIRAIV